MNERAFTLKTLVFGLLGLAVVCGFPAYCEKVLSLQGAIKGYLPAVPLLLIVLVSFVWNATLGRASRKLSLGSRELAVVFCLLLVASWIPSMQSALLRHLVLPRYEEMTTNASWQEAGLTARLPDALFPSGEQGKPIGEKVHFGFIQGKMKLSEIPYGAWLSPLLHWMPLLVLLALVLMALAFLVHRQWSAHEQLRYPLATVADALIRQEPGRPGGTLYRNRLFWFSCLFALGFHLLRYLHAWFPNQLPKLPTEQGLEWQRILPVLGVDRSNAVFFLLNWMPLSFAVVGIAYFVPADVSLSMGLTAPLGTLLGVQYYLVTGNPVSSADLDILRSGGFIAFGLILAYTGRTYYFPVLARALLFGRRADTDPGGVWAARIFLAGYVSLIAVVRAMGADWLMAWVIVTFVLLVFLVVTRLVCETGVPSITPAWSLPGLLTGLFGAAAVGPAPLAFVTLLGATIVSADSAQLFMPYMATSLKVLEDNKVDLRRFAAVAKGAILLTLAAGFLATLTIAYTNGEGNLSVAERGYLAKGVRDVLNLKDTGQLEAAASAGGLAKLALLRPDGKTVRLVLVGLGAVVLTYLLRFRFAKWPLHPLFFVVLGSTISRYTWFCFLLGWAIKSLVVRFGGGRAYQNLKPLFIGLIVGEFLMFGISFVVGTVYHLITGNLPEAQWMLL